ncbi:hypothetical protein E3N88_28079 [Mikania micrantha]|uniref:Uncharacterized protein n=1 Tax=Mikania micrantha TaxID=192012 RepID=A0A5N6MYM9_9ASTR|nr:hypothetical protein E3N88_28079 [Mikania micrantha]
MESKLILVIFCIVLISTGCLATTTEETTPTTTSPPAPLVQRWHLPPPCDCGPDVPPARAEYFYEPSPPHN